MEEYDLLSGPEKGLLLLTDVTTIREEVILGTKLTFVQFVETSITNIRLFF